MWQSNFWLTAFWQSNYWIGYDSGGAGSGGDSGDPVQAVSLSLSLTVGGGRKKDGWF